MKNKQRPIVMPLVLSLLITLAGAFSLLRADVGTCGGVNTTLPFTDVTGNGFFCQIAAAYFSGLTNGTTATTYSPGNNVTREQMAAFTTRTLDQSLKRGSRRAALEQFYTTTLATPHNPGTTAVGDYPIGVKADGQDLWVVNNGAASVSRVRASDGALLGTWTGMNNATGLLVALGRIWVVTATAPGKLYMINPTQPPGAAALMNDNLGDDPIGIAFDGSRIWTANQSGSVSIITLFNGVAVANTVATGLVSNPYILYDGAHMWITGETNNTLKKLDANGAVLQTVAVGGKPAAPIFDGTNLWVPTGNYVTVIRAATGAVLATLAPVGMGEPTAAAFDGERVLVTDHSSNKVFLWKATDLRPLGSVSTGINTLPSGVCSDGLNFWVTLSATDRLLRF